MAFNQEMAQESVAKIGEADLSLEVLTYDERKNLIGLLDDFVEQQGWSWEELEQLGRISES